MHEDTCRGKRFSIIIPALNEEKLIENLLRQFTAEIKNGYDIEVIVSDGGSSDSTVEISSVYADRLIKHNENFSQNISQGRNEGAKYSRGDVLVFLNADTLIKDTSYFLSEIVKEFENRKTAAIAVSIEVFPEEARMSDKLFHRFYNNYVGILNRFIMGMGRGECHVIKRDKFFDVKGYDETLAAGEDFDLYKRLRKTGKVKFRKDLIVYESPRRYRKFGYGKVFLDWTKNSVSVLVRGRSISKKWDAVR